MIIAFDFDGVLVSNAFPGVGEPNELMISSCKRIQELEVETVLWTSRVGEELQAALDFCRRHELKFTTVNECTPSNIQMYADRIKAHGMPRKVYADAYIDDRMIGYDELTALRWLHQTIKNLEKR